ncbi:MAG: hypothetical protein OXN84_22045 [Albidovulum sp.]|nr:hypothetical protein [Albidovulum sp.]
MVGKTRVRLEERRRVSFACVRDARRRIIPDVFSNLNCEPLPLRLFPENLAAAKSAGLQGRQRTISEYQYYEFQSIDRGLSQDEIDGLENFSSRAEISESKFSVEYSYGDFRGNPRKLMEKYFDIGLYYASWGTTQLLLRFPKQAIQPGEIDPFLKEIDWVTIWEHGDNIIVDIDPYREHFESYRYWDEEGGQLDAMVPLRTAAMAGDLRVFYLVWLKAIECELLTDEHVEPIPGLAPLGGALEECAHFFENDGRLVRAAAQQQPYEDLPSDEIVASRIAEIPEARKNVLLERLIKGDKGVAAELRRAIAPKRINQSLRRRTVGELRAIAKKPG